MVFASLLKNDEVLNNGSSDDILEKFMHPGRSSKEVRSISMPEITALSDVYETGALCQINLIKDESNILMPYILNIYPVEKARATELLRTDDPVGPLTPILAEKLGEDSVQESDLEHNDQVNFKFLKSQFKKCAKIAPDERFA